MFVCRTKKQELKSEHPNCNSLHAIANAPNLQTARNIKMIHAGQSNFQDSILQASFLLRNQHHHHDQPDVIISNYMYRIFLSIFHSESGYKFLRLIYFILNTRWVLLLYKDQVADFYALYWVHC